MQVNVLAFGKLAQITGSNVVLNEMVVDTDGLQAALHSQYPGLAQLHYSIAVNKQVVQQNTALGANATVALLPPFSGG